LERLQKIISNAGISSRRKAEQMILDGRITINGEVVNELGAKADPENDDIKLDGKKIIIEKTKIVVLLNKPLKVITSMDDPQGRRTVLDYLDVPYRVYPVGRLDYETEGLLLLTNDGELANRLMHPSYELDKTYEVVIQGSPSDNDLEILRKGIYLDDSMTSPAQVRIIQKIDRLHTKVQITIHEGKNRQVRRMFEYIKTPVKELKRIKYGFLTLAGVKQGEYRILSDEEIINLRQMVKLN